MAQLNKARTAARSVQRWTPPSLIVDADAYRRVRDRLAIVQESFNDPQWRAAISRRLLYSEAGTQEDLTLDMRLGRTSVVADIAQVRERWLLRREDRGRTRVVDAGSRAGHLAGDPRPRVRSRLPRLSAGGRSTVPEQVLGEHTLSAANREIMRGLQSC